MICEIAIHGSLRDMPHPASISGLLCRSTTCDEKFSTHIAAVNVERTAVR